VRVKTVARLLLCAALAALAVSVSGCRASGSSASASIVGFARYSGKTEHSGITVSAERTDPAARSEAGPSAQSAEGASRTTTGADGAYTLAGLPAGTYRVTASSEESVEKAASIQVTVQAGQTVNAADLVLIAAVANPDRQMKALQRHEVGAGSTSQFRSLAVDRNGSVYAAGYIEGNEQFDFETWSFGGGAEGTSASNLYDVQLVKLDSSGVPQWKQTVSGGSTSPQFESVAVDARGNVYVAGWARGSGTYSFGPDVEVPGYSPDYSALLAKYDASGKAQWAQSVNTGHSRSVFSSIAVDSDANVYAAGAISGGRPVAFGEGVEVRGTPSEYDAVLVKYDTSGTVRWARAVDDGTSSSQFSGVAVDANGNLYAAGSITGRGRFDFGAGVDAAGISSGSNAVLVKYDSAGTARWARTVSAGDSDSRFSALAVDSAGSVCTVGTITGTSSYDFGGSTASGSSSGDNMLLVKYDSAGKAAWAKSLSAGGPLSQFSSVAVDSSGTVYAAGVIGGTGNYVFGGSVEASGTLPELTAVLVVYDSSGTALSAETLQGGSSYSEFRAVAVGGSRSVYAAGDLSYMYDKASGTGEDQEATEVVSGESAILVKYASE
jgi:outer membrane protein assembly factor BamB